MIRHSLIGKYADMMDGLRSYYAKREGDNSSAAISAALLLALLLAINVASILMLVDVAIHDELKIADWISDNRGVSFLIPAGIAAAHLAFAKVTGVYDRRGQASSPNWALAMKAYIAATATTFCAALLTIAVCR